MAGASADGEVNHWPAFVDVLTTVIMVVTFLLVIMSAAIMALSQKAMENFKKQVIAEQRAGKLVADASASQSQKNINGTSSAGAQQLGPNAIRSPVDAETGTTVAQLGSILKSDPIDGTDRLSIRTRETPDTLKLKVKAQEQAVDSQGVEVKTADLLLRVDFDPTAVRYASENEKMMLDYLKGKDRPGMKYEIWSFVPQTSSVSEAQRIAFFRAAMTRNILIKAGINPSQIVTQIRVTDSSSKDGHNVRVVLKP
jgi:hypothetical protein